MSKPGICDPTRAALHLKRGQSRPGHWVILCSVIDNFGDLGVSWRLARQLTDEHQINVQLWVDDWNAARTFLHPEGTLPGHAPAHLHGIELQHWQVEPRCEQVLSEAVASAAVVLEMFGCALPTGVIRAMANARPQPRWINVEYLSAEDWVPSLHNLPSPQTINDGRQTRVLKKRFCMPGFDAGSGGLLREHNILDLHNTWQSQQDELRQTFCHAAGLDTVPALWISLFCYTQPTLQPWLQALTTGQQSILLLVPEGSAADAVAAVLGHSRSPPAGTLITNKQLTVLIRPFVSQHDYDQTLSLCDINLVRGEDSFVRAQWAARPFLWHIYPQSDGAHLLKLESFIALYGATLQPNVTQVWGALMLAWNSPSVSGDEIAVLWHDLRPHLPALRDHARNWQQSLAALPDLASSLVHMADDMT